MRFDSDHTLRFCVLGSGSRGNASIIGTSAEDALYLVDSGLSPRETRRRLEAVGLEADQIVGIVLTHLDADHFHRGWLRMIDKRGLQVHVHERHRSRALRSGIPGRALELFDREFALGSIDVAPVRCAHDQLGTIGFRFSTCGRRLGFVTDLGRVPESLFDVFTDLHALAIESNYDPEMQWSSDRPLFLKQRITSGAGHLSNHESVDAVRRIAETSERLAHAVPLHLSRDCNDPALVRRLYQTRLPQLLPGLVLSSQRTPTQVLRIAPARQPVAVAAAMCERQLTFF